MKNLSILLLLMVTMVSVSFAEPEGANVNPTALDMLERSINYVVTIQTNSNSSQIKGSNIRLPLTETEKLILRELMSSNKVVPGGIMLDISSTFGSPTTIGEIARYILACDSGSCPLNTKRFLEIQKADK